MRPQGRLRVIESGRGRGRFATGLDPDVGGAGRPPPRLVHLDEYRTPPRRAKPDAGSRLLRPMGGQMYTMSPPDALPPQPLAVLTFLRRELAAGRAPSLAEIAEAFGFASRNAAQKHVQALVADGLLELEPGRKRGLRLPGRPDQLPLPVLGQVAAGVPIGADIGSDELLLLD